jgi:hypothetical protein
LGTRLPGLEELDIGRPSDERAWVRELDALGGGGGGGGGVDLLRAIRRAVQRKEAAAAAAAAQPPLPMGAPAAPGAPSPRPKGKRK